MQPELSQLVSDLVASGVVNAASAVVGDAERVLAEAHGGWVDGESQQPLTRHHRFDFASLTKPWTATLALALDQRGLVPLDMPIGDIWATAPVALGRQSLARLLCHRSGMVAWRPLYRHMRSPRRLVAELLSERSIGAPKPTYSDLGYMLWACGAEEITNVRPEVLFRRHVLRPMGISTVETTPAARRCAVSLMGNEREVELAAALGVAVGRAGGPARGSAQDGNARFLGGVPGHAGLFGPARAVWRLGAEWLGPSRLLTADSVSRALAGRGRYGLGWWRRGAATKAAGPLTAGSYGHHGFTGGSVWIDPERQRVAVLLAHRFAYEVNLDPWRRRLHHLIAGCPQSGRGADT